MIQLGTEVRQLLRVPGLQTFETGSGDLISLYFRSAGSGYVAAKVPIPVLIGC